MFYSIGPARPARVQALPTAVMLTTEALSVGLSVRSFRYDE